MKLTTGYRKPITTSLDGDNSYLLLAGGSQKALSDLVQITGALTITGSKTFSSLIYGNISGNAGSVTDGVYASTTLTITGSKTFSSPINGDILGNATTADRLKNDRDGVASTGWQECKIENGVIKYYNTNTWPTLSDLGGATSGHTHGNITNGGGITADPVTISGHDTAKNGDYFIIADHSDSGKLAKGLLIKASISSQGQSTKFLREDGTWAAPSYTTNTNTASAVDNILDGSNSGTAITYAPYTTLQAKLSFDISETAPSRTDRLNLNGYLYASKLYSGGVEVLTSHQSLANYITKNTQQLDITGNKHFQSSVEIDSLTAGNLTVSGASVLTGDVSLGTVKSGVWNGTAISSAYIGNLAGGTDTVSIKYLRRDTSTGALYVNHSDANDNTTYTLYLGSLNATSNSTSDTANGSTYLNLRSSGSGNNNIQVTGSGSVSVKAKNGLLTISGLTYTNNITSHLRIGSSGATSNATSDTTNTTTYLSLVEGSTQDSLVLILGDGTVSVKAKDGVLTITGSSHPTSLPANGGTSTYASNVGSSSDYVTAALVKALHTWYTTATSGDTDTLINNWNDIVRFLENTSDETTLQGLLASKLNKAGGTITGDLIVNGGTTLNTLSATSLSVTGAASFSNPINGDILGNATTADRLKNARTIELTGNVTGSGTFDGSGNLTISTTVSGGSATDSSKLPLSGGTMTGTPYIYMPASAASIPASLPFGITYGKILCYGTLSINANTDNSGTKYIILTSGKGVSSSTADGLAIGTDTLTWKDLSIYHSGNLSLSTLGGQASGNYVTYETSSTRASVDGTNSYPVFYNLEGNNLISDYKNYWYVLNMGKHTDNNYASQIAMPYQSDISDSDIFIRTASGSSWRSWRRLLHNNNFSSYAVSLSGDLTISGNKTFSSSVSIDSLTSGNLVVNGNLACYGSLNLATSGSIYHSGTAEFDSFTAGNIIVNGSASLTGDVSTGALNATSLKQNGTSVSLEGHTHGYWTWNEDTIKGVKVSSAGSADSATTAARLSGGSIPGWGTLTSGNGYTNVSSYDYGTSGAYSLAGKDGALSMQVDGFFYLNEGAYKVLDTSMVSGGGSTWGSSITVNGTTLTIPSNPNSWRPVGTGATDAAAGNHTHTLSIAADTGDNLLTLAYGTKYKLTAGGQDYIFTTPASDNTWRGILNNLTSTSTTESLSAYLGNILNAKFGDYVTLNTAQTIEGSKTFSNPISGDLLGNATTADRLKISRTINGIAFDGSSDITISALANGGTATYANYLTWEAASSSNYLRLIPIGWGEDSETTSTRFRPVYSSNFWYRTDTLTLNTNISGNSTYAQQLKYNNYVYTRYTSNCEFNTYSNIFSFYGSADDSAGAVLSIGDGYDRLLIFEGVLDSTNVLHTDDDDGLVFISSSFYFGGNLDRDIPFTVYGKDDLEYEPPVCSLTNIHILGTTSSTLGFFQSSDIRLKNVLNPLDLGKAYQFLEATTPFNYEFKNNPGTTLLGVSALEIELYYPEIVSTDRNGFKSVLYDKLSVILLTICKDLNNRLKALENVQ